MEPKSELVDELAEFMESCCAIQRKQETTVARKLEAVNVVHEQWVGRPLRLSHFRIKAYKESVKRAHAEGGNQ